MITFTRADAVAPGDPVTSAQYFKLATAFNDRLRSGLGDPTFRIWYYLHGLFRSMINPSDTWVYPPESVFWQRFQMLPPTGTNQWPEGIPGEPEGANLANALNTFIFGNASLNLDDEGTRVSENILGITQPPRVNVLLNTWYNARAQRGVIDPSTGEYDCPAWTAAQKFQWIRTRTESPIGNSRGGYLPTPPLDPVVDCPQIDGMVAPNFLFSFTPLREGLAAKTYPGSCYSPDGVNYMDHVHIGYFPWAYVVYRNDGTVEVLSKKDYLEGPYESPGRLTNGSGDQLSHAVNAFIRDFRGSDGQRVSDDYNNEFAFDFQRFFSEQYWSAPMRYNSVAQDNVGDVSFSLFHPHPSGTLLNRSGWGSGINPTSHTKIDGFVMLGAHVMATYLSAPLTLEFVQGTEVIGTVTLDPAAAPAYQLEWGFCEKIVKFSGSEGDSNEFTVRLATDFQTTEYWGSITVQTTEVLAYRPELQDAYLVLRAGSGGRLSELPLDGSGKDEAWAKTIFDGYFETGEIRNYHGNDDGILIDSQYVNANAVYDAARRMSHCVRVVPREQFLGYEVTANKTILYFKRHGLNDVDFFDGITDGIKHTADAAGWSNQWLVGVNLRAGNKNDEQSVFKLDAYTDYFTYVNRCHLGSCAVAGAHTKMWANYGQASGGRVLSPETPSGYNYMLTPVSCAGRANWYDCDDSDTGCLDTNRRLYSSCRIYEPDAEIESAVTQDEGGVAVVKITLKKRIHHCPTASEDAPTAWAHAPDTVARDWTVWDATAITAEPFRSVENGLREYLLCKHTTHVCSGGTGNQERGGNLTDIDGSCYPNFFFTKLVPLPHEDGSTEWDSSDSRVMHDQFAQMELYLRAMCEGYVDGELTGSRVCEMASLVGPGANAVYDFSFPNLCYHAFGQRNLGLLGTAANDYSASADVRNDYPWGHGPLPNTYMQAEVFNRFVSAINALDSVRVMLPMSINFRYAESQAVVNVPPSSCYVAGGGWGGNCGAWPSYVTATPAYPALGAWTDWAAMSSYVAECSADINLTPAEVPQPVCDGNNWQVKTYRKSFQVHADLIDGDSLLAIPPDWRDMLETNSVVYAMTTTERKKYSVEQVDRGVNNGNCTPCEHNSTCGASYWYDGEGKCLRFWPSTDTAENGCLALITGQTYDAPAVEGQCVFPYNFHNAHYGQPALRCNATTANYLTITPILVDSVLKVGLV